MYLIKLKTTSLYKDIINNIVLIAFGIVLLLISFKYILLLLIFIIYVIYIYKINKNLFKLLISVSFLVVITFIIYSFIFVDKGLSEINGIITDIEYEDSYNKIFVNNRIYNYIIYDYDIELKREYNIGDYIEVKGINIPIEKQHIKLMYNSYQNLISSKVVSVIQIEEIHIEGKKNIYYIKEIINNYVYNNFDNLSCSFIKALVLGDTSLISDSVNDDIKINGISHLFAISGLHISIIIAIFEKLLKKIKYKDSIINIFLGFYLFITNFSPSILRCVLMVYLKCINKKANLYLSSLDIISIVFIILIIINPFYMYKVGFILSFLVSFTFIIVSKEVKGLSYLKSSLVLSIISFLVTIPIIINLNNSINILSILVNVIFIAFTSFILLPLTLITFIFPYSSKIYSKVVNIFISINHLLASKFSMNIVLPSMNIIEILIYYFLLFIILKAFFLKRKINYRIIFLLLIFFFCYYNKSSLNVISNIEFLDLKDGEAILINSSLNGEIILIDTGDGTNNEVTKYLKKRGIRKIDYLILTHGHEDHNGELEKIINEIKVNNIIISAYYNSVLPIGNINIIEVTGNESIKTKSVELDILSPVKKSDNENDNSIVIGAKLGNYKYLFLGDASNSILDNIMYDADIIKAGHHGSKTSASFVMYKNINPKYVIIQTGRTKKYNFPDVETIDLLNELNIKYYQTNVNGTVTIYYTKIGSIIKSLR